MIITSAPREWAGESPMLDCHIGNPWQPPTQWAEFHRNALGIRGGTVRDERICVIPLWLVFIPASILSGVVLVRSRREIRRVIRRAGWQLPRHYLQRVITTARLTGCALALCQWICSLGWYGFQLNLYSMPIQIKCDMPGAIRASMPLGADDTGIDPHGEWAGFALQALMPLRNRHSGDLEDPPWQAFPGFDYQPMDIHIAGSGGRGSVMHSITYHLYHLTIPYWAILILLTTPDSRRVFKRVSRAIVYRHRQNKNLCGYCGYDLRGIRGRCPECGMKLS
jgi:hypothetical protein